MAQVKSSCLESLGEGLELGSRVCQDLEFYPKHHAQIQDKTVYSQLPCAANLTPRGHHPCLRKDTLSPTRPFPHPDTFSQCSWQQGVVDQLVLPDLSNFNNTNMFWMENLMATFDGYFFFLFLFYLICAVVRIKSRALTMLNQCYTAEERSHPHDWVLSRGCTSKPCPQFLSGKLQASTLLLSHAYSPT